MSKSCPIWMRLDSHPPTGLKKESCPIRKSHIPHKWIMSHMKESCPIWISQVSYEWVLMIHMDESRFPSVSHKRDMTWLFHMGHNSFIWDMTLSYGSGLIVNESRFPSANVSCVCVRAHVYLCLVCVYARTCICVWCVCTCACVSMSGVCVRARVYLCLVRVYARMCICVVCVYTRTCVSVCLWV